MANQKDIKALRRGGRRWNRYVKKARQRNPDWWPNLTGADLTNANLIGADLTNADLRGANLSGAFLTGADLSGADLSGADLSGAFLAGADLTGSRLSGVDLSGADLTDADLTRADLSGARYATPENPGARGPTRWPEGFVPPPGWDPAGRPVGGVMRHGRHIVYELAGVVDLVEAGGGSEPAVARFLDGLQGVEWLRCDGVARSGYPAPLAYTPWGSGYWDALDVDSASTPVAVLASMHHDGRVRERAVMALRGRSGRVATAALATRSLDHAVQVRTAALTALAARRSPGDVETALGVLLAADRRFLGPTVLADYADAAVGDQRHVLAHLRHAPDRSTRRWAFQRSIDRGLVSTAEIAGHVEAEPDQLLRSLLGRQLCVTGASEELQPLLASRYASLRRLAVESLPDADVAPVIGRMLIDPSRSVQAAALERARGQEVDAAAILTEAARSGHPRQRAAAIRGLARAGTAADLAIVQPALTDPSASVRVAAVEAAARWIPAQQHTAVLGPHLFDASPKVASAAAQALARSGPTDRALLERAWNCGQPWTRRAAWRLQRSAGSWDRVEADLHAATDPDEQIARLGRTGIGYWLVAGAATTWGSPRGRTRDRIESFLDDADLDPHYRRLLVFHCGLTSRAPE